MSKKLTTRTLSAMPSTYDPEARKLRAVAATEQPAKVVDWERWEMVDEVLRMDGLELPKSGQVPLLDSHNRGRVSDVIGSARSFDFSDAEGFRAVDCDVHFADTASARETEAKFRDGHLTDFSVGYEVKESTWVPDGERAIIGGKDYTGPLKVATRWILKELSATPVGADDLAKARNEATGLQPQKEDIMSEVKKTGAPAGLTEDQAREMAAQAVEAERKRTSEIREAVRMARLDSAVADELCDGDMSPDQARKEILKRMADANPPVTGRVESGETSQEKFRSAVVDGLAARAGIGEGNEYRGRTLIQLAEESLRRQGVNLKGKRNLEIAGLALRGSTSDFPYILANTANKVLQKAYQEEPTSWRAWCGISDGSDFKTASRPQISEGPDLELKLEGAEYQYGALSEFAETNQIKTYGKLLPLTREAIINDDKSAFARLPRMMGAAAARLVNSLVYTVLTSNQVMAYDSVALFYATGHANLAGTGGALSDTTLAAGRAAMRKQTGPSGAILNIIPRYLIVPAAVETAAEILLRSTALSTDNKNEGVYNPWRGNLMPVVEPLLDASDGNAWYLAASPSQIDTVEVMFLDGVQTPYLEEIEDPKTDGIAYKVRIDVGVRALDHRGLYMNDGGS